MLSVGEGLTEIRGNFKYTGTLFWNRARTSEGAVLAAAYAACVSWVDSQVGRAVKLVTYYLYYYL